MVSWEAKFDNCAGIAVPVTGGLRHPQHRTAIDVKGLWILEPEGISNHIT